MAAVSNHQQFCLQNVQSDNEEYMDLDEFFSALQDCNSITPFGKSTRQETGLKKRNIVTKSSMKKNTIIQSQLSTGKVPTNCKLDSCPCSGKDQIKSEDEAIYRQFLCDSILVNHLLTLLPASSQQNVEQHRQSIQNQKICITL